MIALSIDYLLPSRGSTRLPTALSINTVSGALRKTEKNKKNFLKEIQREKNKLVTIIMWIFVLKYFVVTEK